MFEESFPERLMMRTYDESGSLITEYDEEAGWFKNGVEQNEFGEWIMNRVYHPYTEEQLFAIKMEKEKAALEESRRQLSLEEVTAIFMRSQINTADIPDQTSLRMMGYYPEFTNIVGQTVKLGFKFVHENKMYKTAQANLTIQEHYPPGDGMESLYTRIDLEHTGAIYDPIPYEGNMELFNGKYYAQDDVLYICTRDSVNKLTHKLSDLVGLYVDIA